MSSKEFGRTGPHGPLIECLTVLNNSQVKLFAYVKSRGQMMTTFMWYSLIPDSLLHDHSTRPSETDCKGDVLENLACWPPAIDWSTANL